MKILYIGTPETYRLYKEGKNPSHWLYGAVEMEKDGHEVFWESESISLLNDLRLVRRYKPDAVFIPNLNLRAHYLLLLFSSLHFIGIPIYAYLHHSPISGSGMKQLVCSFLFTGLRHCFFLSKKTMTETVSSGCLSLEHCSLPSWGPDMDFYKKYKEKAAEEEYYISTGKENRDFQLLIDVFKETKKKLKIITCQKHGGREYSELTSLCENISNIEVIITENSGDVYPFMLREMASAKALVCPLLKENLTYCVGLSTITDAEGLGKPLIITANPYHDKARISVFNVVEDAEDWIEAINNLKISSVISSYNMCSCYKEMKRIMFN